MKVSAIVLFCIVAVAVALPQPHDGSAVDDTKITLADIESEMLHGNDAIYSDNPVEAARQKRFVFHLKKLALAKAGLLGLGALGVAGAVFTTKNVLHNVFELPHHGLLARASPRLAVSYPNGGYYTSQYFRRR